MFTCEVQCKLDFFVQVLKSGKILSPVFQPIASGLAGVILVIVVSHLLRFDPSSVNFVPIAGIDGILMVCLNLCVVACF